MRLSVDQIKLVRETVTANAGNSFRIYVFGSRLQEDARGGDLDLLLEGEKPLTLLQRTRIKLSLEQGLEMPVDIISMQQASPRAPFQTIAYSQGVLL